MEQTNIIFLVILLLIVLYCSERLLLIVREHFTESLPPQERKTSKCGTYVLNTIDHDVLSIKKSDYLKKIVEKLVDELNRKTELKFKFLEFEHVIEQIFNDGSKRFIIDFLIHETENYYNKRLILDLIVSNNEGIIKNLVIGNGRKEEIDVMKVQHYNFDHKIISDDNLKFNNIIKGMTDSKLDFGTTDLKNTMGRVRDFKSWVEPKNFEVGEKKTWPCREQSGWWDENGVNYSQIPSDNCKGINTSFTPTLKVAQFRPDHKNRQDGENDWTFNNYLQIGSDLSILP
jgi:hypothetical protein